MQKALTIAGSDCSGGAGLQADLKTFAAHGVYGMSVVVAVVAENTCDVLGVQDITPVMIGCQIDAVFTDIVPDAVKIGMLSGRESMRAVAAKLKEYQPKHVVIDPVMYAKGGAPLMEPEALTVFKNEILPQAYLLTPNIPEAEILSGLKLAGPEDMARAAQAIYNMGAKNVLIKGGHAKGEALDILYDGGRSYHFSAERIDTKNTHGTGCTYSSAIAANLALGLSLPEAVQKSKDYVTGAIKHALPIGKGHGPTNHFYDLYQNGLKTEKK